jgi:alkylation response protein AidB-like acyl-CoA dehydrogenase
MSLLSNLKGGGRHGVPSTDQRDAMGVLLATVQKVTTSSLLDRLGVRKQAEQLVYTSTSGGFRVAAAAGRQWKRAGAQKAGVRVPGSSGDGLFDLTPTEDEQMLVDVVGEYAAELVRPAAPAADDACETPAEVLAAGVDIGLPMLGVPESLGGIAETRSAVAGSLVAEALAKGDMGIAVATLAPGAVATAIGLWGTEEQQQTYLPAFTGEKGSPAAALALSEPRVLFDPLEPATTARRTGEGFVLDGTKSAVVRGAEAELFVVGASLDGVPTLFLVESGTPGLEIEADPSMGLRAAALTRLTLTGVEIPAGNVLGDADSYRECVRLSRLAWCALSLGTAQAVLDYVTPYVKERQAFGEPIAHRQSVAFMVANIAIELQAMRLLTYKAASRAGRGEDVAQDVAWARKLCAEKAMQIGNDGVQLLGGHGFVKEHPVERWYRDLRAVGLMEGAVLV